MDLQYNEITSGTELSKLIDEVTLELGNAVVNTMGPYGNTVILTNRFEGPYTTKDGVSVIKAAWYNHPVKHQIAELIKEVAAKTLKVAGDGTTTAVCLLRAFVEEGQKRIKKGASYIDILKELNELQSFTLDMLDHMSEDLNPEDIYDVALISANGDSTMAHIIEEAFQHSDNVKVEEGFEAFDTVEKVNGMVLNTGYLDPAFVNVPEKDAIIYDSPKIIIIDGKLNDLRSLGGVLEGFPGPWIIIADDMSPNVQSILRDNYNRGALTLGVLKTPGFGGHRQNLVKDLSLFTDAEPVKYGASSVAFGQVDSIVITKEKTTITKKELSTECKAHAHSLTELYSNTPEGQTKDLLEERVRNIKGELSIIKVGGISTVEVKEKFDRYDDAVRAVGCALEEGIVPGGGQALHIVAERAKEGIHSSFVDVLEAPMNSIEVNSNYALNIANRDMMEEKIYDPTKVTKTAFKNAISISKALLNANYLILDSSLWR